jgi:Zn-dependent protease with chaperone function
MGKVIDMRTPRQGFRDYVRARTDGGSPAGDGPAPYAHPTDSKVVQVLSTTGWRFYTDDVINAFIKVLWGTFLRDSVWVSPTQFPDMHRTLALCAERLGIAIPRLLLGSDAGDLMAFTMGTDRDCFVYASALMVREYSSDEMLFVLGHECGHIHNHHVTYESLAMVLYRSMLGKVLRVPTLPILLAARVPLLGWVRRAEITADRAGLLCCRDIDVARKALIKLRLGFDAFTKQVNVEEFLKQEQELRRESFAVRASELFYTHPLITKRIKALELFARSELYYDLSGLPRPTTPLLDRDTLEAETQELIKVL